ncbi:hypothetical protein POM88_013233 [Heracleum sosnowskyi]|uniref:Uncharacterized protein n=1 Tax=Heracleum sosnowskyi TaxID=360622 RepID=A0AAD8IXZ5_9APIA|nr:hypothetical protein POM88_013233 [Heracleum sosnowskyi]
MTLHAEWDINYIRKPCPDNIRVDDVLLKAHKDNYALVLQADLFLHNYKEIAKRNSEARQKITETHTTGSTSFAQVAHMLRLEKLAKLEKEKQEIFGKMPVNGDGEGEGNGEEDPIKVSEADIYLATRKRDENREYKLREQVLKTINDKIVDVKKTLETEDTTEDFEKFTNSEKSTKVSYEDDNDVNID